MLFFCSNTTFCLPREYFSRKSCVNNFEMPSRLHQKATPITKWSKVIVCVWAFRFNFLKYKYLDFMTHLNLLFCTFSLIHFRLDTLENAPYRFLYFLSIQSLFYAIHCPTRHFIRRHEPWIRFYDKKKFNFNFQWALIFDGNEVIKKLPQ